MSNKEMILTAVIYSAAEPSESQKERFAQFLKKKYSEEVPLKWERSDAFPGGFRLEVGSDIYDWSVGGRFRQLRDTLVKVPTNNGNIIPLLKESISAWTPEAMAEQVGEVLTVGDGIATVGGLPQATFGEILLFSDGVRGMVQDIRRDAIGCVLFSDDESVTQGSSVKRTGKTAGTPVGEAFLGRVVDSLGSPVDGLGEIEASGYMPVEAQAPPIIDRQPVDTPLETGIFSIDSMFPIGRGQRELIIGDRQTGKTAIAVDAIINQKGKDCICIYVAIGQKTSSVVQIQQTLKKHDAMDHTIIVTASASDPAPLQYIAPYAGCAMAEYFMRKGKDVRKDQTYFLWKLTSQHLSRTLFPLGELTKGEVREIAAKHGFVKLSQKKESEEICFVLDNDYRNFLKDNVPDLEERMRPGKFVSTEGKVLGRHEGLHNYTIGQRRGLGIALGTPAYVVALDAARNRVVIGGKEDLRSQSLIVSDLNLTKYADITDGMAVDCRIRYRSQGVSARLYREDGGVRVEFDAAVESVTPGQSAVFYEGDDVVGGGVIC